MSECVLPPEQNHWNLYGTRESRVGGYGWRRCGPSCLIETNCSPLPSDTDSRPFVPAGLCWEQQKGNVLILAKDKVRGFLLHPSYLSLCAHPLEQAQRLSSSGDYYILLD